MTRGTTAHGKRNRKTHIVCRRCGNHSYHVRKKRCASCGFGASRRVRTYGWGKGR
ncbi:MAG TPA: 50S ribosomal protein L37e [Thermoplasmata archaeon]|nr:50S ribosomal protein L37e [Thermoplasmata archaeon]